MDELRLIVNELNKPPFSKGLTLVSLDEKTADDILQLVVDILAEMDSNMKWDVKHEAKDAVIYAITDFVAMLNYKAAVENRNDFQALLADDNRRVIHSLLYWLLRPQCLNEFKTRAYLARFLRRLEIPQQFMTNDESDPLRALSKELRCLQEEFVSVHRNVTKLRNDADSSSTTSSAPKTTTSLAKAIEQMESEKTQLEMNISRIQAKISSEAQIHNTDMKAMLSVTNQLRKLQEEQSQLQQSYNDQNQLLKTAQFKYDFVHRRWRDIKDRETAGREVGLSEIIERLKNEVHSINARRNKLILDITEIQKQTLESQQLLTSKKITEEQVTELEADLIEIRKEVHTMEALKEDIYKKTDDQLRVFRNQASAMENKRKMTIKDVTEAEEDLLELKKELADVEAELGIEGSRPRTQADIKRYMAELQIKTQTYKTLKHQLQEGRNELAVLIRTEEILRSRDDNLSDLIQNMEQEKGITGYEKTQGQIEKVSMVKSGIDVDKGATLQEMSQVVTQVLNEIKSKKHELGPIVQELKEQREIYQQVESKYIEKKRVWDSIAIGFDNERSKLEYELDENSNGFSREESQFHLINSLLLIEDEKHQRLQKEKVMLQQNNPKSLFGKYLSYRHMLETMIREKEQAARNLRKQQKDIQMDHSQRMNQRNAFNVMKHLVQTKIQLMQVTVEDQGEHNFLKISQGDQYAGGVSVI